MVVFSFFSEFISSNLLSNFCNHFNSWKAVWFPISLKIKNTTGSSKCAAGSVKCLFGASNYVLQHIDCSCTFWGTKICSWINKILFIRRWLRNNQPTNQTHDWIRKMLKMSHKKGQTLHKHRKYCCVSQAMKNMKAKLTTFAK